MLYIKKCHLNQQDLKAILEYSPSTGEWAWKVNRRGKARAGRRAGTIDKFGYRVIRVDGINYFASRLAWFYCTGQWPLLEMDHKNGIVDDDRLENLRPAERWQNRANQKTRKDSKSGYKGVRKYRNGWMVRLRQNGKTISRYGFKSPHAAHMTYIALAKDRFGAFARAE